MRRPPPGDDVPSVLSALTERELQVLREMAAGPSNLEIAQALFLSEATARAT